MKPHDAWVIPDWPAARNVHAFVTTRAGGVSSGEHESMNLGLRCGDFPENVARNRHIVRERLPAEPHWMVQVHGTAVADLDVPMLGLPAADAAVCGVQRRVAVVLTADCMPLFFCDEAGTRIGIAHAGWRGMASGVIENTVAAMNRAPASMLAWMGPAIGPRAFEVGAEVREAFLAQDSGADVAFVAGNPGKYYADLYALARRRLERAGVTRVFGGDFCTFNEPARFFSYRRSKASGRMGAFIWME